MQVFALHRFGVWGDTYLLMWMHIGYFTHR